MFKFANGRLDISGHEMFDQHSSFKVTPQYNLPAQSAEVE
jgi:hypothetical protein